MQKKTELLIRQGHGLAVIALKEQLILVAMSREMDDIGLYLIESLQDVGDSGGESMLDFNRIPMLAFANPLLYLADLLIESQRRLATLDRPSHK